MGTVSIYLGYCLLFSLGTAYISFGYKLLFSLGTACYLLHSVTVGSLNYSVVYYFNYYELKCSVSGTFFVLCGKLKLTSAL